MKYALANNNKKNHIKEKPKKKNKKSLKSFKHAGNVNL